MGGGGRSVLVVDDDEDQALILSTFLESVGYEVEIATSVATARAALTTRPFDVLIADLLLGDGTSLRLLHGLAACRPRAAIMLTGCDAPEDVLGSRRAGYDVHLVKPAELDQIVAAITESLANRNSGVRLAKAHAALGDVDESVHVNGSRAARKAGGEST